MRGPPLARIYAGGYGLQKHEKTIIEMGQHTIFAISSYQIWKHIIDACTTASLARTVKTDRLCTWLWQPWRTSVDFWQAWWCGSVEYMHLIMTDALSLGTVSVWYIKNYAYRYMYIPSLVVTVMLKVLHYGKSLSGCSVQVELTLHFLSIFDGYQRDQLVFQCRKLLLSVLVTLKWFTTSIPVHHARTW